MSSFNCIQMQDKRPFPLRVSFFQKPFFPRRNLRSLGLGHVHVLAASWWESKYTTCFSLYSRNQALSSRKGEVGNAYKIPTFSTAGSDSQAVIWRARRMTREEARKSTLVDDHLWKALGHYRKPVSGLERKEGGRQTMWSLSDQVKGFCLYPEDNGKPLEGFIQVTWHVFNSRVVIHWRPEWMW